MCGVYSEQRRGQTRACMFSVDAGSITEPVSTLMGRGLHCLMRAFVASLPKTAKAWSVGGVKPSAASGCAQKSASLSSVPNMDFLSCAKLSLPLMTDDGMGFAEIGEWIKL